MDEQYEICEECRENGNDYTYDDESACPTCPFYNLDE